MDVKLYVDGKVLTDIENKPYLFRSFEIAKRWAQLAPDGFVVMISIKGGKNG